MINRSVTLGPNYRKITVSSPRLKAQSIKPGQCIRVDGVLFALTAVRDGEFEAIVPNRENFLDKKPVQEMDFPVGRGFADAEAADVHIVAGGCGLGAFVTLVEHRNSKGLKTRFRLVGRGVRKDDIVSVFPELGKIDFECWDTVDGKRPALTDLVSKDFSEDKGSVLFFAGPRSLYDALKTSGLSSNIHLNY